MITMYTHTVLALVLAGSLALWGCSDDEDGSDGSSNGTTSNGTTSNGDTSNGTSSNGATSNGTASGAKATFATYNVGLARGFVDFAKERLDPVVAALNTSEADVLCLQEVWLFQEEGEDTWSEGQIDAVLAGTASTFPHTYYEVTTPDSGEEAQVCTQDEIDTFGGCAQANCADVPAGELTDCVLGNCATEFAGVSSACQGCAAANLGQPLETILAACSPGGAGGGAFAYNGHNGLLLLSRHPLSETDTLEMTSALTYRAALRAKVAIPEFGDVDVTCTHIAADLGASVPYPEGGEYSSYGEENAAQIEALAQYITTGSADKAVLLGDFNTGPAKGDAAAELPDNYNALLSQTGMSNPYVEQDAPLCTYCADNTLVSSSDSVVIDHVLLGIPGVASTSATRIFDQTTTISTDSGEMEMNLSDHFGVSVEVTLEP